MANETYQAYDINKAGDGTYQYLAKDNTWQNLTPDLVGGELNDNTARQFRDGMRQFEATRAKAKPGARVEVQQPLVGPATASIQEPVRKLEPTPNGGFMPPNVPEVNASTGGLVKLASSTMQVTPAQVLSETGPIEQAASKFGAEIGEGATKIGGQGLLSRLAGMAQTIGAPSAAAGEAVGSTVQNVLARAGIDPTGIINPAASALANAATQVVAPFGGLAKAGQVIKGALPQAAPKASGRRKDGRRAQDRKGRGKPARREISTAR